LTIIHNSIGEVEGLLLKKFKKTNLEIEYEIESTPLFFIVYLYLSTDKKEFESMIIDCLKSTIYKYELKWNDNRFILKIFSSNIMIKDVIEKHTFNRTFNKSKRKKR